MTETALWLLRHPEPEVSTRGRCYGSLDVALSPEGLRQARAIAASLAETPFDAIYSSPRRRCQEAARILASGRSCPVETMAALREMDFGDFEGRTYDEIAAEYPEVYRRWMEHPTETEFPNGEGFRDMSARILAAAGNLRVRHVGQSIALVTHGGVIRILLAEALGMEATNIFRIGQRYGAINMVRYFDDYPIVELVNAEVRIT